MRRKMEVQSSPGRKQPLSLLFHGATKWYHDRHYVDTSKIASFGVWMIGARLVYRVCWVKIHEQAVRATEKPLG